MYGESQSDVIVSIKNQNIPGINPRQILPHNAKHNFKNLYRFILKPKCISCHSGEQADDDIDLTTYDNIINHPYYYLVAPGLPLDSSLYLSVQHDDMPSKNPHLTKVEKDFIKKWIELNAPFK